MTWQSASSFLSGQFSWTTISEQNSIYTAKVGKLNPKSKQTQINCEHCKKTSHTKDKCWVLHPQLRPQRQRAPGNVKMNMKKSGENVFFLKEELKQADDEEIQHVLGMNETDTGSSSSSFKGQIILDSGCSCHIIGSLHYRCLQNVRTVPTRQMRLLNNHAYSSSTSGDAVFEIHNVNGSISTLMLTDITYIKEISTSFISISQLCNKGAVVTITNDVCTISRQVSGQMKTIATAKRTGKFYTLNIVKSNQESSDPEISSTH